MGSKSDGGETERRRVGLIYDEKMCKHTTPDGEDHPECPNRILSIWNKLVSARIPHRCLVLDGKEAEDKYIASVHTKHHIDLIKSISSKKFDSRREKIAAKYNSIYFNKGSSEAAQLAAGSVLEVTEKVAKGELDSAFAIVRPPGHHAEEDEPMGFCLYNNIAVATSFLLNEKDLGINKILIVDWDVHHGNGTQNMFYKDPRVLFFSVHRHESGSFYPGGYDGSHIMIGEDAGAGYNINVPWENGRCGDADYNAVWDYVLIPVVKEFNPDIILISAGFDAALGDPLGGCRLTPYGYSVLLKKLMEFARGKIVMVLEGGYNLNSLANSVLACVRVLLDNKAINGSFEAYPFESTWRVIKAVREELGTYWPVLKDELPTGVINNTAPLVEIVSSDSDVEDEKGSRPLSEDLEKALNDILEPFAGLGIGVNSEGEANTKSSNWRSEFSKIDVWYACFGSNMCTPRFLCYIQGGQVEGMKKQCVGSFDKSPPKEMMWKTVPHRLFFGRDQSKTWGLGGVAFLHPESNKLEKAHTLLYRITLEQFNDVLIQENISSSDINSAAFGLTDLHNITDKQSISVEALKFGWYHNVVYLGSENGIPILTITCTLDDIESFKTGKVPICAPSNEYASTLIQGLVDGNHLLEEEAVAYVKEACTKPL